MSKVCTSFTRKLQIGAIRLLHIRGGLDSHCTCCVWEPQEDIGELHSHVSSQHKAAYQIILLKTIFPHAHMVRNC